MAAAAAACAAKRVACKASRQQLQQLVALHDCFVFDLDGTVWKGSQAIEGAANTLRWLQHECGKTVLFITNNSSKSRANVAHKLQSYDITAAADDIITSSFAAAACLKNLGVPAGSHVYVVGQQGLMDELAIAGYKPYGGREDGDKTINLLDKTAAVHVQRDTAAVVAGLDWQFNYYKIQHALQCMLSNAACVFVASNTDARGNFTVSQEWPGAGTMVAALQAAIGRPPMIAGKPSNFMLTLLKQVTHRHAMLKRSGCADEPPQAAAADDGCETAAGGRNGGGEHMCMVGDRADTDIAFGNRGGMTSLLVLTGVTREHDIGNLPADQQPHLYTDSIADLFQPA